MNNSGYISEKINDSAVSIKLKSSVLGGNDALEFTSIINQLTNDNYHCIIVDASSVEIINSTGIGMLANAHSVISKNGLSMIIVSVPDKIMKLFAMTHLDRVFRICENLDEAIEYCKSK